ncbi:MAG: APC family permease [Thaumarchaeota archaeon]|nr:APC family permease [Nitrososphaerota archaeon]
MEGTNTAKKVFTRDSTGLVKNVSFIDAITLNLGNMSIGAGLGVIGLTTILLPADIVNNGFNLVLTSIVAFLLSIPQIVVYTMMTRRLPRTGGDYVWTSRTFGGFVGSTFSFMGYTLETLAYLALIALSAVFAIGGVGVGLGFSGLFPISLPANFGGNAGSQFVVAAIIFALLIAVNIFSPKSGYRLVSALILVGIVSLVISIFTLIGAGSNGVTNYLHFAQTNFGANQSLSASQVAAPPTASAFNVNGVFFLIPFFALFVYPWLNAAPAVASEMKGKSALRWNVPISALISLILITSAFGAMYVAGGFSFVSGALTGPLSVFSDFNYWTFAMGVTTSYPLQAVIGLGWIVWNIGVLAYGVIVFSRYLFAQSFDRFLPEQLSYVSPKYSSPVYAHVLDLVVTISLIGISAFVYGTLSSLFGNVVAAMAYFVVIGLAASVYALRKEKGTSKGILFISGILMAAIFVYITYLFLANGSVWGGNLTAYGYVIVSFVLGAVIYLASKRYHAARGIDISLAYKEIPPE